MEGGSVGHNFERDPPKDHPCQVWFNLVQGFQRRRFKCESLRRAMDGRTTSDGKSSHGLWPGELKKTFYVICDWYFPPVVQSPHFPNYSIIDIFPTSVRYTCIANEKG